MLERFSHVALEDADDLTGRLALEAATGDVVLGRLVRRHAGDHDAVEGVVGPAVTAAVEAVAPDLARGGFAWSNPTQVGEGGVVAQPFRVVTGDDEQLGGDVEADAVHAQQTGRGP